MLENISSRNRGNPGLYLDIQETALSPPGSIRKVLT